MHLLKPALDKFGEPHEQLCLVGAVRAHVRQRLARVRLPDLAHERPRAVLRGSYLVCQRHASRLRWLWP